jgi:hypothetical protein
MKVNDKAQSRQREPVLPAYIRSTSLPDLPQKPQRPLAIVSVETEAIRDELKAGSNALMAEAGLGFPFV